MSRASLGKQHAKRQRQGGGRVTGPRPAAQELDRPTRGQHQALVARHPALAGPFEGLPDLEHDRHRLLPIQGDLTLDQERHRYGPVRTSLENHGLISQCKTRTVGS